MSKKNGLRFKFIEYVVGWEAKIKATYQVKKFKITRPAVSDIIKQYREYPTQNLHYNQSSKAFIATQVFNHSVNPNTFSNYLNAESA
ncbi:MAG: hypothetical protein ACI9N3_001462 [Colwellia sp.]|jgi:hypothetical protein